MSAEAQTEMLQVRVSPGFLAKLDEWIKSQPGKPPTRQDVVRQVLGRFLDIQSETQKKPKK